VRQRLELRRWAAALNSLSDSAAAELASVELIFVKAAARDGYESRLSTIFNLDADYASTSPMATDYTNSATDGGQLVKVI